MSLASHLSQDDQCMHHSQEVLAGLVLKAWNAGHSPASSSSLCIVCLPLRITKCPVLQRKPVVASSVHCGH